MKIKLLILSMIIFFTGCKSESETQGDQILESSYNKKIEQEKIEEEKAEAERLQKIEEEKSFKKAENERLEAERIEAERIANLDPYKNYTKLNIKSENLQTQKIIDDTILKYENVVDDLRNNFLLQIEKENSEKDINIKELNVFLDKINNKYDLICMEISAENLTECKSLGVDKLDLELKIKALENGKNKTTIKLKEKEIEQLDKYKSIMVKNIDIILSN